MLTVCLHSAIYLYSVYCLHFVLCLHFVCLHLTVCLHSWFISLLIFESAVNDQSIGCLAQCVLLTVLILTRCISTPIRKAKAREEICQEKLIFFALFPLSKTFALFQIQKTDLRSLKQQQTKMHSQKEYSSSN